MNRSNNFIPGEPVLGDLNSQIFIDPSNIELLKEQLKLKTNQYGDFEFSNDIWYCNKLHKDSRAQSSFTIKFDYVEEKYKEILKYFALIVGGAISNINKKVKVVQFFIDFLDQFFPDYDLKDVNPKILNKFEFYLSENIDSINQRSEYYGKVSNFFVEMADFPGVPTLPPTKRVNPFKQERNENEEMYIPKYVVEQLDKVMRDESNGIPLELRGIYWLLRSFPNRGTEVGSVKINCIKSIYSYFVINVPTWKQNGGYIIEEIKTLPVIYSGHGKYIIDLIRRVQKKREESLRLFPIENVKDQDYLFLIPMFRKSPNPSEDELFDFPGYRYLLANEIRKDLEAQFGYVPLKKLASSINRELENRGIKPYTQNSLINRLSKGISKKYITSRPFSTSRINRVLNIIIKVFNIRDEQGEIFHISSHQFRHNAITDRLYLGGFTIDQIRSISGHKNEKMPLTYAHKLKNEHKKMWEEATGLTPPEKAPVEFKGVIVNLEDENVLERLSRNPRAYLTWEANSKKGVGLCSSLSCNPKGTTVHFECYECDWFVPKIEYYDDYKAEYNYWIKVMEDNASKPNRAAHFENAIRNSNCIERILNICEYGTGQYKNEIAKKLLLEV